MFFCTGVGHKNVLLVEELRVRGSWHGTLANKCIMTADQCIFSSNYLKGLRRLMKCSLVQE